MKQLQINSYPTGMSKWDKAVQYDKANDASPDAISQDFCVNDPVHNIYSVADGSGTGLRGLIAATAVSLTFRGMMIKEGRLPQTSTEAINRIYDDNVLMRMQQEVLDAAEKLDDGDVSSTFTGLIITPDQNATFLHVGDSRLILCQPDYLDASADKDGSRLLQQTTDQVTSEGNHLTNYLGVRGGYAHSGLGLTVGPGMRHGEMHRSEWGSVPLDENSRLLLMTNGAYGGYQHERVNDTRLHELTSCRMLGAEVSRLVALEGKKLDDVTVMAIDLGIRKQSQYRLAG